MQYERNLFRVSPPFGSASDLNPRDSLSFDVSAQDDESIQCLQAGQVGGPAYKDRKYKIKQKWQNTGVRLLMIFSIKADALSTLVIK